jgi:hypothetical protein
MDPDWERDWRIGSKSATAPIKPILSDDLQRGPFWAEKSEIFRALARPGLKQPVDAYSSHAKVLQTSAPRRENQQLKRPV